MNYRIILCIAIHSMPDLRTLGFSTRSLWPSCRRLLPAEFRQQRWYTSRHLVGRDGDQQRRYFGRSRQ